MGIGFQIKNPEHKKDLRKILDLYRNKQYKETPLLDNFDKILQIISLSYENDKFKSMLYLVYDVILRKEQEKKESVYYHTSSHRKGQEVLNFLFDLINHISGYTEKYYDEVATKMNHEQLIIKYR